MVPQQQAARAAAVLQLPAVYLGFSLGSSRRQARALRPRLFRALGHVPHYEALLRHPCMAALDRNGQANLRSCGAPFSGMNMDTHWSKSASTTPPPPRTAGGVLKFYHCSAFCVNRFKVVKAAIYFGFPFTHYSSYLQQHVVFHGGTREAARTTLGSWPTAVRKQA